MAENNGFGNGRVSLRDYMAVIMSSNDEKNAQRFQEIQRYLERIDRDREDHESRLRKLEKRGVFGHVADGALLALTLLAGALGWKTQAP